MVFWSVGISNVLVSAFRLLCGSPRQAAGVSQAEGGGRASGPLHPSAPGRAGRTFPPGPPLPSPGAAQNTGGRGLRRGGGGGFKGERGVLMCVCFFLKRTENGTV